MSSFAYCKFRSRFLTGGSSRRRSFRLNADPQPTKKTKRAPDIKTPRAPPPPPLPPPPPPPIPPPLEPEEKILGVNRRFMIPFLISLPLSGLLVARLWSERIEEEVVASVDVPMKTRSGVQKVRRDVKLVAGKSGVPFVVGRDRKGRRYMVDANGILFYDSGISQVGWYAVNPDGEITNIFLEDGQVKAQAIGNIDELKEYTIDEFMGMPIQRSKITGFRDKEVRPLPPNIPLVTSKNGKDLIPPFYVDEGEMTLEERKFTLNPFRKNGEFEVKPMKPGEE